MIGKGVGSSMAKDFIELLHLLGRRKTDQIEADVENRFYEGIEEPPADYSEDEKDYYLQWLEAVKEKNEERCRNAIWQTVMMRLDEGKEGPPEELDKKWHEYYNKVEAKILADKKAGRIVNYSFPNNYD